MRALLLLAGVYAAHALYYKAPTLEDRAWWAYVGTHALLIVTLALLLSSASRGWFGFVGAGACWWGIVESAQAVGCSLLEWRSVSNADLCVQAFGSWPYAAAASLAVAWLITDRWWRLRNG